MWMYSTCFKVLDEEMRDTLSKCPMFDAILHQLWNDSVIKTYFGRLMSEQEAATYVLERIKRWNQSRLVCYS